MSATELIVDSGVLCVKRVFFGLVPGSVNLPVPQAHQRLVVSDRFGKVVPAEHLSSLVANKPSELGHYYLVDVRKHSMQFPCRNIFRSRWGQLSILAFVDAQIVDPHAVVAGGIESLTEPVYRAVIGHLQGVEQAVHDELEMITSRHEVEHAVGAAFAKYGFVGELGSAPSWLAAQLVAWRVRVSAPHPPEVVEQPREVVLAEDGSSPIGAGSGSGDAARPSGPAAEVVADAGEPVQVVDNQTLEESAHHETCGIDAWTDNAPAAPAGVDDTTVDVRDSADTVPGVHDTPGTSAIQVSNPAPSATTASGSSGLYRSTWG